MVEPIIEIRSLSHRFANGTFGLRQIDLAVESGSFVVFAGENGSGKTTLFRHLNGLLLPTTGTVYVSGKSVPDHLKFARQTVGMMFQDPDAQIVGETVAEDVAFGPENLGLTREQVQLRTSEALTSVGLLQAAGSRPHELSGGEKRRLAIAGILAMEPEVVVFDEPFSSLDYPGIQQVLRQLVRLQQSGHTVLVATHLLEIVVAHADRLVLMNGGTIKRDGPPGVVLKDVEAFGVREPCASRLGVDFQSWLN